MQDKTWYSILGLDAEPLFLQDHMLRHYRVPLSYDLNTFQILGQKLSNFFVGILVQTMTPKGHFEIN